MFRTYSLRQPWSNNQNNGPIYSTDPVLDGIQTGWGLAGIVAQLYRLLAFPIWVQECLKRLLSPVYLRQEEGLVPNALKYRSSQKIIIDE